MAHSSRQSSQKREKKFRQRASFIEEHFSKPERFDRTKKLCECENHNEEHASYDVNFFNISLMNGLTTNFDQLFAETKTCECENCPHIHYSGKNTRDKQMEFLNHVLFTVNYLNYNYNFTSQLHRIPTNQILKHIKYFQILLPNHIVCGNCVNLFLTYADGATKYFAVFVEMFKTLKNTILRVTVPCPRGSENFKINIKRQLLEKKLKHNKHFQNNKKEYIKQLGLQLKDLNRDEMSIYINGFVVALFFWQHLVRHRIVLQYILSDVHLFKFFLMIWIQQIMQWYDDPNQDDKDDHENCDGSKDDDTDKMDDSCLELTLAVARSIIYFNRNHLGYFISTFYNYYSSIYSNYKFKSRFNADVLHSIHLTSGFKYLQLFDFKNDRQSLLQWLWSGDVDVILSHKALLMQVSLQCFEEYYQSTVYDFYVLGTPKGLKLRRVIMRQLLMLHSVSKIKLNPPV